MNPHEERFWPTRMRWRLRGAWMWPSFAALTLLDGLLLHHLSPVREGIDLIPAILVATFGNIVLIGAVAPWLARRMWKRRPAADPGAPAKAQLEVLSDRIGTGLLVASVFGILAAGLANRPVIVAETDQRERAAKELFDFVTGHGDAELRRNLEASDTRRYTDGYYRSCIPDDDRERWTCFFIDVRTKHTRLDRDPSQLPNRRDP
ncbi:MAG: hypothetical protein QOD71_414 [Thermoleophilaceae bacterium]|nr:hypothetical protein [Thermoleophilaceae bacterium]